MYAFIICHHGLNKSANCAGKKNIYACFDFIDLDLTGCVVCICCINSHAVNLYSGRDTDLSAKKGRNND